jgi:hypothetical protein
VHFNEIYASHSGTDTLEFIELIGVPGLSLSGYMVLIVEGEGASAGTLDRAWDLTGFSIPPSGYFLMGNTAVVPKDFDISATPAPPSPSDRIENGTETFYIVFTANPASVLALIGTQLDPEADGVLRMPCVVQRIVEVVGMYDGSVGDRVYDDAAPVTLGPDSAGFFPAGIYRGLDFPNPWCQAYLDFDPIANLNQPRTPGTMNSPCPLAPPPRSYCTSGTTSNGCFPIIRASGNPSALLTPPGTTLAVTGVEGQKQGLIFYGITGTHAGPWGTGFLCVKAPTQRTPAQGTGGHANDCDGVLVFDFNKYFATHPGALGMPWAPGVVAWYQGWFRDPPAPKTTNLSNGLEITHL